MWRGAYRSLPPILLPSPSPVGSGDKALSWEARGLDSRSMCPWASPFSLLCFHFPIRPSHGTVWFLGGLPVCFCWEEDGVFGCLFVSRSACLSDCSFLPLRVPREMWVPLESKASLDRR